MENDKAPYFFGWHSTDSSSIELCRTEKQAAAASIGTPRKKKGTAQHAGYGSQSSSMTTVTTTETKTFPNLWTCQNLYLIPQGDEGNVSPALVVANREQLWAAVNQLKKLPAENAFRQCLQVDEHKIGLSLFKALSKTTADEAFLVWLDGHKVPRIEPASKHAEGQPFLATLYDFMEPCYVRGEVPPPYMAAITLMIEEEEQQDSPLGTNHTETTVPTEADSKPAALPAIPAGEQAKETAVESMEVDTTTTTTTTGVDAAMELEDEAPATPTTQKATTDPSPIDTPLRDDVAPTQEDEADEDDDEDEQDEPVSTPLPVKVTSSFSKTRRNVPRVSITPRPSRGRQGTTPPKIKDVELFRYVTEKKITPLLKSAGFVIRPGVYALPGKDPEKNGSLTEGVDFFTSLSDFRLDLMKYGVHNSDKWTNKNREDVAVWIRQGLLQSGDYRKGLPEYHTVLSNYKSLMRLANFQYWDGNLGCCYAYPGIPKGDAITHPYIFNAENELMTSLAKNGLPAALYKDSSLTKLDLLGIEIYVDYAIYLHGTHRRNLFHRETTAPASSRKRIRLTENEDDTASRTSLDSTSSRKSTRSTASNKSSKKQTPSKKTKTTKTAPSKNQKKSTPAPKDTPVRATRGRTPTTPMTTSGTATVVSIASPTEEDWPAVIVPVEVGGDNDRERLANAHTALSESAEAPIVAPGSKLAKNLREIRSFLGATIRSLGRHGGGNSSKALYACGTPGTGKTLSITWLCKHVLEEHTSGRIGTERDDDKEDISWRFCHKNINNLSSPATLLGGMANAVGVNSNSSATLCRRLRSQGLILVVDEMDLMVVKSAEWKTLLETLLGWANDPDVLFTLVGISNSLMDEKFVQIQELGKVSTTRDAAWYTFLQSYANFVLSCFYQFNQVLTFATYSENELEAILRQRVGTMLMDKNAVAMVARKIALGGGDARKALDMAATAVRDRLEVLEETDDDNLTSGPIVNVQHVHKLNRKENQSFVTTIQGLPAAPLICLVILSALAEVHVTEASLGKLRTFALRVRDVHTPEDDFMSQEDFVRCIETLQDAGLLRLQTAGKGMGDLSLRDQKEVPIRLGLQLEDVQAAIKKVCTGEFYDNLASRAKENPQEFVVQGPS
jgi:Cdc6-like AAA superfamily ATPase